MDPFKKIFRSSFSHEEMRSLVALCSGMALLVAVAVFISASPAPSINTHTQTQAAATALGDAQGVPLDEGTAFTGQTHPAYTTCWVNWSDGYGGWSGGQYGPPCSPTMVGFGWGWNQGNTDTFATGIFSVDLGGSGQSIYASRTWSPGYIDTINLGSGTYLGQGCLDGSQPWANPSFPDLGLVCGSGDSMGPAIALYDCSMYTDKAPAGYSTPSADSGGACSTSAQIPPSLSAPRNSGPVGSAITVNAGQPMTMEWSCLPSRTVNYQQKIGQGKISEGGWYIAQLYSYGLASGVSGSGPGFAPPNSPCAFGGAGGPAPGSPGGFCGTQTVTAPSPVDTTTYNYSLACNGGTNWMTIPVTVTGTGTPPPPPSTCQNGLEYSTYGPGCTCPPGQVQSGNTCVVVASAPTLGISSTGNTVGSPVTITATFLPGTGDSFTHTVINGCTTPNVTSPDTNCQNALTDNTGASSPRTFTFTPTTPGTYYFYPAAWTNGFPYWSNWGKSLAVTVSAASCVDDGTRSCSGNNVVDNCGTLVKTCSGATPVCSGGTCVANVCTPAWLCTNWSVCTAAGTQTCTGAVDTNSCGVATGNPTGSTRACTPPPPTIVTFSANPTRVRANTPTNVTFSWSGTNLPPAGCSVSGTSINAAASPQTTSISIPQPTVYTLTCGSATAQTIVNLIPLFQEI